MIPRLGRSTGKGIGLSTPGFLGFLCSSAGKESTCNMGDLGSIPGLGRSPGEGIGCPLRDSWASLVAQLRKNPPATQETWVQSLGGKIPWRRKWHPIPVFLPGKSHGWRSLVGYSPWGCKESDTTERLHFVKERKKKSRTFKVFCLSNQKE